MNFFAGRQIPPSPPGPGFGNLAVVSMGAHQAQHESFAIPPGFLSFDLFSIFHLSSK